MDRQNRGWLAGMAFVTGLMLLAAGVASAQGVESREISDRWNVRLEYVSTDTTTDLAAGNVLGAVIRIEDVLGFDESESNIGLSGFYRFGAKKKGKHAILFNVVDSTRDASGTVSATVPIFDEEFIGDFSSEYDVQSFGIHYRLSLVRTDRAEAGVIAGLSTFDYSFKLSGTIDDGMGGTEQNASSADFLAPLPTFGFFLKYAVTPKLIFEIGAAALDIEIGDVDGRVLVSEARLTWYFTKHLGVGLGMGGSDINITNLEEGDLFKIGYRQTTGAISLSAVF